MKNILLILFLFFASNIHAQKTKVLFLGNSYTAYNDLPQLTSDLALSTGDTIIVDKNTPGGYRLEGHVSNSVSQDKISSQDWDFVVLQAQSQEPTLPLAQLELDVFPYAEALCYSIRENNPCSKPLFYMTRGRENGDASNCPTIPEVCTYEGMDSLLNLRYRIMAEDNEAYVSPVGAVWHYIRDNHPDIQLYTSDGSHPSQAGSYAAACTFYSMILHKDPTLIQDNFTLSETDANIIKNAAKVVAFDDLAEWNVGAYDPVANFTYNQTGDDISFTNASTNFDSILWDFGDGNTSTDFNPTHNYSTGNNSYMVTLVVSRCGISHTISETISVMPTSTNDINENENEIDINFYPNPTAGILLLEKSKHHSIKVNIYDATGNLIVSQLDPTTIDLKRYNDGLYFVRIEDKTTQKIFTKKLILMKDE